MYRHSFFFSFFIILFASINIDKSIAEEIQGARVASSLGLDPELLIELEEQEYSLRLVGEAERSFLFFDVYNIGYYSELLVAKNVQNVELLHLIYERDLSKEKVQSVLREGIEENIESNKLANVDSEVTRLLGSIGSDIKAGDTLSILKHTNGTLALLYNDRFVYLVTIESLSSAIWNIWMGSKSVVDRDALLNR